MRGTANGSAERRLRHAKEEWHAEKPRRIDKKHGGHCKLEMARHCRVWKGKKGSLAIRQISAIAAATRLHSTFDGLGQTSVQKVGDGVGLVEGGVQQ